MSQRSPSAPRPPRHPRAPLGGGHLGLCVATLVAALCAVSVSAGSAAVCGDGNLEGSEKCEAPFGACCNAATCQFQPASTVCRVGSGGACDPDEFCTGGSDACPPDVVAYSAEDALVLRATADTRIMETHRSSNNGATGLFWIKRSPNVRGVIGFDTSCQAAAAATLTCAQLEMSVDDGVPTLSGTPFSAHRLDVPWVEGNQAFDDFSWSGEKLGPFPGTGTGTTWNCRIDTDLADSGTNNCLPNDMWWGGDICGSGPCYEVPATDEAIFADSNQETMLWDVTADVVGNPAPVSWLLKVTNEADEGAGGVKLYQRNGARFIAEIDPSVPAHVAFDLAPRLLLYGSNLVAPEPLLVEPVSQAAAGASIVVGVDQASAAGPDSARWENKTVGTWGYMVPGVVRDWEATIPLAPGPNEVEFTVFDSCSTEGQATYTLTSGPGVFCGNGVVEAGEECDDGNGVSGDCCSGACTIEADGSPCNDKNVCTATSSCQAGVCEGGAHQPSACGDSYLCYSAGVTKKTSPFFPISDLETTDALGDAVFAVRRATTVCMPGSIDGEAVLEPTGHFVGYKAKEQTKRYLPGRIEVTDRFGTIRVDPIRADGLLESAGLDLDTPATPLAPGILDGHECYKVRLSTGKFPKGVTAGVVDAFEDRTYAVRKPTHLCLAVDQAGGGVVNPDGHLMCYKVSRASGETQHQRIVGRIHTEDAFGTLRLDTRREAELCVSASIDLPLQ